MLIARKMCVSALYTSTSMQILTCRYGTIEEHLSELQRNGRHAHTRHQLVLKLVQIALHLGEHSGAPFGQHRSHFHVEARSHRQMIRCDQCGHAGVGLQQHCGAAPQYAITPRR